PGFVPRRGRHVVLPPRGRTRLDATAPCGGREGDLPHVPRHDAVPRAVAPRARAVRGVGRTERGLARGDPRRRRPPHGLTQPAPPGRPTTAPSRARARHHPQTRTAPVRRRTGGTCRTTPWRRWGDRPRNAAGPATGRSRALLLHGSASADHHGEDVARGQDEVVLAAVLDLGAAVLAVDDLVAHRHV